MNEATYKKGEQVPVMTLALFASIGYCPNGSSVNSISNAAPRRTPEVPSRGAGKTNFLSAVNKYPGAKIGDEVRLPEAGQARPAHCGTNSDILFRNHHRELTFGQ